MATDLLTPADVTDSPRSASRLSVGARRFVRHKLGMAALVVLGLLVLLAVLGPYVWPYSHTDITPDLSQPPSLAHPMGTDSLGRDLLAMVIRGLQQSLLIATTVTVIASLLGITLGVVSGFFGGLVDTGVMRLVDLVLTLPTIALAAFLGNMVAGRGVSWAALSLVLGAIMWTSVARLVRGVVLGLRAMPYVDAARVMGASPTWIMARHLAPNVTDHIVVGATLMFGHAILAESGLSFLGFGVQPPDTSLGLLVAQAQSAVLTRPWLFFFPGLLVVLLVLTVNYIGEGLRDAFNPRSEASNPLRDRPHGGAAPVPPLEAEVVDLALEPELAGPVAAPVIVAQVTEPERQLASLRGWTVSFGDAVAVAGIDLDIAPGEVLALVGESGSGKSLTAMSLVGLLPNTARTDGSITFEGQHVESLSYGQWREIRGQKIATILQDPSTSLNPVLTIGAHFADTIRTVNPKASDEHCHDRAIELMNSVAIPRPEMRVDQYPHQLSGGLRQRISIALAMVHDPSLIIADEPTTALDVTVQAQVIATLKLALARTGAAMLFITHDLALVAGVADRVAVMQRGRIVELATVHDLFESPQHPYTQRLMSLAPRLASDDSHEEVRHDPA